MKKLPDGVARKSSVPGRHICANRVGSQDSRDLYANMIILRLKDESAGEFYKLRQELKIDEWYENNLDRMPSHRSVRGGGTSRSAITSVKTGVGGSQKQPFFLFK